MQRKPTSQNETAAAAPSAVRDVLRSPGEPLDAATRALMESRLGHNFSRVSVDYRRPQSSSLIIGAEGDGYEREADANAARIDGARTPDAALADFGGVRVHADSRAAESAAALGASAYTVGRHIVFGAGRYAPQTGEGRALLAHELTHVLQQAGPAQGMLQRAPDKEDKGKGEEKPVGKFAGCGKDRQAQVEEAIKGAEALAKRAIFAFERDFPLPHEIQATKAHFGDIIKEQRFKIIDRYKHVLANLAGKTYTCSPTRPKVREGDEILETCAQASCPGNKITVFPNFGSQECPAVSVMLHEAIHNAGACDDIKSGQGYPPSNSEENAYSYENFAVAVAAGTQAPTELKKRDPKAPKAGI